MNKEDLIKHIATRRIVLDGDVISKAENIEFRMFEGVGRNNIRHYLSAHADLTIEHKSYGSWNRSADRTFTDKINGTSLPNEPRKVEDGIGLIECLREFQGALSNFDGFCFFFEIRADIYKDRWSGNKLVSLKIENTETARSYCNIYNEISFVCHDIEWAIIEHVKEINKKATEAREEYARRKTMVCIKERLKMQKKVPSLQISENRRPEVDQAQEVYTPKVKSLYLMKDESDEGVYKIGISNSPKFRESTLQKEKPTIKMVGSWSGLSLFESLWHKKFKDFRIRGEWFRLSKVQVELFCKMNTKPVEEIERFLSQC